MRAALALVVALPALALAGPPYLTDDPEPVELHHWELYLASLGYLGPDGQAFATAPHVEVNFGVLPDVQLHLIAPLVYSRSPGAPVAYGYGDTELGVKWRFVQETEWVPMIGTFPLLEIPTGSASRGLGNGSAQLFLNLWIQKSFGPWTTYGGGGYWLNPGTGNRNYVFLGWLVQRQLGEAFTLGTEVYYQSARVVGGAGEVRLDVGMTLDLSKVHHLLVSGGTRIGSPLAGQFYLGWQVTFGPEG